METQSKKCIICEQDFKGRGEHAITCSKRCSKIYNRVYRYISRAMRRNLKQKFLDYWNSLK